MITWLEETGKGRDKVNYKLRDWVFSLSLIHISVERLNGDIRSITQQISGSESRIAVLENDIPVSYTHLDVYKRQSRNPIRTNFRRKLKWLR